MEDEGNWGLVVSNFNGTSVEVNTESGEMKFRIVDLDGDKVRDLEDYQDAAYEICQHRVAAPAYEDVVEHLYDLGFMVKDEFGGFTYKE